MGVIDLCREKLEVLVLQNEVLEATNVATAQLAKGCHVRVILNAAPARPLVPDLSANVDLLVVNAVDVWPCGY
jgi:ribokinase